MNRISLYMIFVLLFFCGSATAYSQDDENANQKNAESSDKVISEDELDRFIDVPPQLTDKFELPEKAPLELGDASDRVREVQASLNEILIREKEFTLAQPIWVGPLKGPSVRSTNDSSAPENSVRLGYSKRYDKAFVIRGNWIPKGKEGFPFIEPKPGELAKAYSLQFKRDQRGKGDALKVDGVYGQHTRSAVGLFQLWQNLPATGKVDVVTLDKLEPMIPTNPLLAVVMKWVKGLGNVGFLTFERPYWVKTVTSIIVTLLILMASAVVYHFARMLANSTRFLTRWLFTPSSSVWFMAQRENKVFLNAAQFAPALFIYFAALLIFPAPDLTHDEQPYLNVFQDWHGYVAQLGLAYVSFVAMTVAFSIVKTFDSIYNADQQTENAIGGLIRASRQIIALVGTVLIAASLMGKSPFYIVGGLGAFTAIILLVFRDYLLGLVASIQIIARKIIKVGDWITMPKYNADGDVQEITLSLIKVQNFDKTISTIPTSSILSESFQNWTGMQSSGGRRIKRSILIDMNSIKVCSPEQVERFNRIELLKDYLATKHEELDDYNRKHDIDGSVVNSRRLTNIGTFRAYLKAYLGQHPGLNPDMTVIVRHLTPTNNGLPIEIYAFCKETAWGAYEAVQADIFDHILSILPEFELRAFQDLTESDFESQADEEVDLQPALTVIKDYVATENDSLKSNRRTRVEPRLERVRKLIHDLGVSDSISANAVEREIVISNGASSAVNR